MANTLESLIAMLDQLPPLDEKPRRLHHKSQTNSNRPSGVIDYFNDHYSVTEQLADLGVRGTDRQQVVRCPWHDDRTPSLVIWRHHETRHSVCRCFSTQSDCPAANVPYLDAFNIYCMTEGLSVEDAVRRVAEEHRLGERRQFKSRQNQACSSAPPDALAQHQKNLQALRDRLNSELRAAATRQGEVTVARITPGLGKTTQAAALAKELHAAGLKVAVVVPTGELARQEWAPLLQDAFIWRSRFDLCSCYDQAYLRRLSKLGYTLPKCESGCPYLAQYKERQGKITIYQSNHLHLNGGELPADADVLFVDESPLNALLKEQHVTRREIADQHERLARHDCADPALPLLRALLSAMRAIHPKPAPYQSLRGKPLLDAIQTALPIELSMHGAIAQARTSPAAVPQPLANTRETERLTRQFLASLLDTLEHDALNPDGNMLLAWDGDALLWFERHELLAKAYRRTNPPAVIILDGSADPLVSQRLCAPWPVRIVQIDAPISPAVQIIQCTVTPSTRRIVQDADQIRRLARQVAIVCQELGVLLDGGVSYLDAVDALQERLGGEWRYYGNQRGANELARARTFAVIASPTMPRDAMERKALALWADDTHIDCTWTQVGKGDFRAADPRLDAMYRLHGSEELRQAAHRCRPILRMEPTTLLIFSPWDLDSLELTPHRIITELPHGNHKTAKASEAAYQEARQRHAAQQAVGISAIEIREDCATDAKLSSVLSTSLGTTPRQTSATATTTPVDQTPSTLAPADESWPWRVGRPFKLARGRVSWSPTR